MASHDDEELPHPLTTKPGNRYEWDFPTAWLLGTQFVASLRDIAISGLFDFDLRDWMSAGEPIDLSSPELQKDGAFWLDFVADSGDSPRLVYQLAYLLQQPTLQVHVKDGEQDFPLSAPLPRGAALVFGGDTAYPIATRRRLLERVRAPFIWARRDLRRDAKLGDQPDVYLLGIPGNHDYYNGLAGFERQFHARGDDPGKPNERVDLPGYKLAQRSSYFAAVLPYGWQFWALDDETRRIDPRQKQYFLDAAKRPDFKHCRIVATSRPTVVSHALSPKVKELECDFAALNLYPAFATNGELADDAVRLDLSGDTHLYERYWGKDEAPELGPTPIEKPAYICREFPPTDAWPSPRAEAPPTGNERMPHSAKPQRANYASVVSGLGGAFHHPSQVRGKPDAKQAIVPRRAWPGGSASDREIGQRLLRPRKLFQAGAVGVIGMVLAALTYSTCHGSILDVPFDLRGCATPLRNLGIVAAIVATVAALGGLTVVAVLVGKKLHAQVLAMDPPRNPLGRFTYCLTHNRVIFWGLRWAGVNRRNAWGVLITLPAWFPILLLWFAGIFALTRCKFLGNARDGFVSTYVIVVLLVLFMAGLGVWKLGVRNGVVGGLCGLVLGTLTALLIVWTPYAWTRLFVSKERMWCVLFFGYWILRHFVLRRAFFSFPTTLRRVTSVLAYIVVVGLYTLVPGIVLHQNIVGPTLPAWGVVMSVGLSAYLSCLWLGWYFFLCLQWNAHGNEAGGAARVVSFAEFLRIKLTADRAEVWVIGVEGPSAPERSPWKPCSRVAVAEQPPIARLVDHFVVERPPRS